jgi:hypothetical protein
MTAPLPPETWDGEAAALVAALAGIDEPIAWHASAKRRYCVLCEEESRTHLGLVPHNSDCLWKHAQWLMNDPRR